MKNIFKYIGILSIAAVALVSCKKEDAFKPGEAEEANCYGVYFPTQEASGNHTYDPTADKVITITVARTNSKGAITVPVEFTSNVEGVFVTEPIQFADGQEETTVDVTFPSIELGKQSSFSLTIKDNQYASKYAEGAVSIDCSILCVEWQYFLNPVTKEPAVFTYYEDWYELVHTCNVRYYEVNNVRYCESINSSFTDADGTYPGFFAGGEDDEISFTWYLDTENPDGDNFVHLTTKYIADYQSNPAQPIYAYDYYAYWTEFKPQAVLAGLSFLEFANKYGASYELPSYDGNGIFHFFTYWGVPALGGGFGDFSIDLVADGFVRTDYSIEVEPQLSYEGTLPIVFQLGADVAKVKYMVFEGELTAGQVANQLETVKKSADAVEVVPAEEDFDEEEGYYFTVTETTLPKTGTYTIIAVTVDEKNEVKESASAACTYVSADAEDQEAHAVALTCGIGSAAKYPGVNTDNALEIWAYGKDIVDAKVGVFAKDDIVADAAGCINALLATDSLEDEDIQAINDNVYVNVAGNLMAGTEYYLLVYASNGYLEEVFLSDESCFTTGDPLPIYKKYTYADWAGEEFDFGDKASLVGKTFNLYGTDVFGDLGKNEYVGKVKIIDNETPTDANFEYITMVGLGGPLMAKYNVSDAIQCELTDGIIFPSAKATLDGATSVSAFNAAAGKPLGTNGRYEYFQAVGDGYYALCASQGNYTAGYDLSGLGFYDADGYWGIYYNMILVDPAKDDNGLAPKAGASISAPRKTEIIKAKNLVEVNHKTVSADKPIVVNNSFKRVEGAVCPANAVKVSAKTVHGARPEKVSVKDQKPSKAKNVTL